MASYVREFAEKLGVKLEERFRIKDKQGKIMHTPVSFSGGGDVVLKFTEGGLYCLDGNSWYQNTSFLCKLLTGDYTVAPYEPGCEKPRFNNALSDVYEWLNDAADDLQGDYLTPEWLQKQTEKMMLSEEERQLYEDLQQKLERICDAIRTLQETHSLFATIRKERAK